MCGDFTRAETPDGEPTRVCLRGRVERQRLAGGTKSEHMGVVLHTPEGDQHVLRLRGGNPFKEPLLEALAGRTVTLCGQLHENFFLLDNPPQLID